NSIVSTKPKNLIIIRYNNYMHNTMSAYFLLTEQEITLFLVHFSANQFPMVTTTSITSTPRENNLLLNPPYVLTHSLDALLDPNLRQRNHSTTPPRPKNSFIIFRKDFEGL